MEGRPLEYWELIELKEILKELNTDGTSGHCPFYPCEGCAIMFPSLVRESPEDDDCNYVKCPCHAIEKGEISLEYVKGKVRQAIRYEHIGKIEEEK